MKQANNTRLQSVWIIAVFLAAMICGVGAGCFIGSGGVALPLPLFGVAVWSVPQGNAAHLQDLYGNAEGRSDIELIHFSRDRDENAAKDWAKENDVKFPVVSFDGGNPLDLHCKGIPHLFIIKANGVLLEEGHPMRLFTEEKL